MKEGGDPDMPANDQDALDPSDEENKKKILAKKQNILAVAAFTMAFETDALTKHIDKGTTTNWPKKTQI